MTKAEKRTADEVGAAKEMARRVIEHHFGSKPRRIVYKSSGLTNFVFMVYHPEGEFIVRLSPSPAKINAFIKEQWAVARAQKAGVPVPEILEVGNEIIPFPYMVSRAAIGHEATYHPKRHTIVRQMGHYAALINSVRTTGFGGTFDWSNNQLSRNDTWNDFLRDELRFEDRLETLAKHRILPATKLSALRSTLANFAGQALKPSLNHGDLRLKNVMVDDAGEVTAIIYWENCTSNVAPQWELSLALHDLSIDEKQEFLQGYGITGEKMMEIAPVIRALNVINYAPPIEELAKSGDPAKMELYKARLRGALDLYSINSDK